MQARLWAWPSNRSVNRIRAGFSVLSIQSSGDKQSSLVSFWLAILVVAIGAGLIGTLLDHLYHFVLYQAYLYGSHHALSMGFWEVVTAVPPERRLYVMTGCGLLASIGWWAMARLGKPVVSVKQAVSGKEMAVIPTCMNVLLQTMTVGMGSPLGREVAPREAGALLASRVSRWQRFDEDERKLLVACGAGAALAAVYNAPLGATVFILEVLLVRFSWRLLLPAFACSMIATMVAWIGVGRITQYHLPPYSIDWAIVVWSILMGPVFGVAGLMFARMAQGARRRAAQGWHLPVCVFLNFVMIGVIAFYLPELLGNGKSVARLSFGNAMFIGAATLLFVLKVSIELSSLRAGAAGGLLTPGFSNGALLAIVLGGLWNMVWPGVSPGAYALVGAIAFLASSMSMPYTALVLMFDLTSYDPVMLIPASLAVLTGQLAHRWLEKKLA